MTGAFGSESLVELFLVLAEEEGGELGYSDQWELQAPCFHFRAVVAGGFSGSALAQEFENAKILPVAIVEVTNQSCEYGTEKVSPSSIFPLFKPLLNQRILCAEVP